MDLISQLIDNMRSRGCAPADQAVIIGDDKRRRYRIEGDRRDQKVGVYQFKIDGDFGVGWFRSHREGRTHKFSTSLGRGAKYTPEQKAEWKAKRDEAMRANAMRIATEHATAAAKAEAIWAKAAKLGESAYLDRKNASLNGARIYRNLIVVPVKISGKLTSLQFISPTGEKKFLTGSELVGGYFTIGAHGDDLTKFIICEGFATGDALRKATGSVVIVAFNAGNLAPVAEAIRKKYPEARITIAADNDYWTFVEAKRPQGVKRDAFAGDAGEWNEWRRRDMLQNPGIEYAKQAAVAIKGARVVWPEFKLQDFGPKPTDFNDALLLYGVEYVRDRIAAAPKEEGGKPHGGGSEDSSSMVDVQTSDSPATHPDDPGDGETGHLQDFAPVDAYMEDMPSLRNLPATQDWKELLLVNGEGKLKTASLRNAILFLKFHKDFAGTFAYNEFHQNIMIVRCPPWDRREDFEAKRLDDITITNCAAELEKYGLTLGTDKIFKAIQSVAMAERFHPAREYFGSLKWDGRKRLGTWLTYYFGCEQEHPEYLAFIGTKWLVAAVKRVFEPGCKFDHVLVIEGEQGLGKSTALKALATFGVEREDSYFTDGINLSQLENKDTTMKLQGSIIIELAELSGFSKKEDEAIKGWIGATFDDARLPYAREVTRFSRQFILAATTNKTDYLKDPTGNRRYWPTMALAIDLQSLKQDREQLWAEAVQYYRDGMYIGPTKLEERLADREREKRLSQDSWTETVMRYVDELLDERILTAEKGFKIGHVMEKMGLALRDRDDRSQSRIMKILQMCGMESKSMWSPSAKRTERFWVRKEGKNHE